MRNTHLKLRGRLSAADVQLVESLQGSDLLAMAGGIARGTRIGEVFRERLAISKLFQSGTTTPPPSVPVTPAACPGGAQLSKQPRADLLSSLMLFLSRFR